MQKDKLIGALVLPVHSHKTQTSLEQSPPASIVTFCKQMPDITYVWLLNIIVYSCFQSVHLLYNILAKSHIKSKTF